MNKSQRNFYEKNVIEMDIKKGSLILLNRHDLRSRISVWNWELWNKRRVW